MAPQRAAIRHCGGHHDGQHGVAGADCDTAKETADLEPASPEALEARAVALVGVGRDRDALDLFVGPTLASRGATKNWLGTTHYYLGEYAQAEQVLRDTAQSGGGDEREFARLWLYLAAERQGGRGREAIGPFVADVDASKLTGALLHYFDNRIDRDALLKVARARPEMERLNLAEAYFFASENACTSRANVPRPSPGSNAWSPPAPCRTANSRLRNGS